LVAGEAADLELDEMNRADIEKYFDSKERQPVPPSPFGEAFYLGRAPYYVLPIPLIVLISILRGCAVGLITLKFTVHDLSGEEGGKGEQKEMGKEKGRKGFDAIAYKAWFRPSSPSPSSCRSSWSIISLRSEALLFSFFGLF
jgi:hypothetical protein